MSFVVSARKYRPRNFDELVGQDHIGQTLKNAMKSDKLAHAFLFAGPRGVGKTTSARILARILNCENLQEGYKACEECPSCKAFDENASFNIFELDAASNNSVDHIRSLNEQVRFQPQKGSYKIYIIDEVHMLSAQAFNAFLKTLEEPPPYAKFILATTEKHKIIPTILSRCQIFDFRRIRIPEIVEQLRTISEKEDRTIDDDALHLIAQKADGAMRDALSIYDKVISSVEGAIGYKEVAENLNLLDYDYYFRIIDAAVKEDFPAIMNIYDEITKKGFDPQQFVPGLMSHCRDLLMIKDLRTADLLEMGKSLQERYEKQAALASEGFLLTALSLLNDTDINLLRSQNKRLSVEIALSKICFMNRAVDKKKTLTPQPAAPARPTQSPPESPKKTSRKSAQPEDPAATTPPAEGNGPDSLAEQSETKQPGKAGLARQEEKPAKTESRPAIKTIPRSKAPRISTNLDNLIATIEEEENSKSGQEQPFTAAALKKIFDDYSDNSDSQSLKTALRFIKIEIEGDKVLILTPTRIYIDFIKQELKLLEKIHETFPTRDLKIKFRVSEEAFPEYDPPKKPKLLTTKEKYDLLVSKNPDFQKLVDTFKLKISNK